MNQKSPGTVGPFRLPTPRFPEHAFEPVISAQTVRSQLAWQQAQVTAVNDALATHPEWLGLTIEELLRRLPEMPEALRSVVATRGASHANHQFFWKILNPGMLAPPPPALHDAIHNEYGSLAGLREAFEAEAMGIDGDGWAFVVMNPDQGMRIEVLALRDDASVLPLGRPGLLVCDLWEHAWAADYADRRTWLAAFWQLIDWPVVAARREGILQGIKQL
ncbi:superoxide dismutase [Burkholderia cepacia]|uniref:superoxide dismutase n=1 Tax=Burkholderia cepacia TaxID=292 RepID=UPI0009BD9518|nr:Fe-Mn family superoxide dismutase [Burkholderia cepacia]